MKTLILKLAALGGMIILVALLWPIFTQAETSLATIFIVLSMAGIGISAMAMFIKGAGYCGQHSAYGPVRSSGGCCSSSLRH